MPTAVTLYAVGVWFLFFLIAGIGWHLGGWLVSRTFGRLP